MESKIENVLLILNNRLNPIAIKWMIAGSLGLALHGLNVNPRDVDLVFHQKDLSKVCGLFFDYNPSSPELGFNKEYEFSKLSIDNLGVELLGDFEHGSYGIELSKGYDLIPFHGFNIPVMTLEGQKRCYESERKIGKIKLIEDFIG